MKLSISHHIILFVLKLKGIKKIFSSDPIDYNKLRKDDVKSPKGSFFKGAQIRKINILATYVTEVKQVKKSEQLLIFIPGGAFISGPVQHHWDCVKTISKRSTHNIWMCNYPKAPENKISTISKNIDAVYAKALQQYQSDQIILIGDSVGGTLITALVQRLISRGMELPRKLILVSPVMDASMSNPEIKSIDEFDPMLSKVGILSAKKMCAENGDLSDSRISPINGSFENFPSTLLFIAEHDIMYPDAKIAVEKIKATNTNIEVIEGSKMPHVWPFLPVMKEAKVALDLIIDRINK